jgi:hypothetical protein
LGESAASTAAAQSRNRNAAVKKDAGLVMVSSQIGIPCNAGMLILAERLYHRAIPQRTNTAATKIETTTKTERRRGTNGSPLDYVVVSLYDQVVDSCFFDTIFEKLATDYTNSTNPLLCEERG